MPRLTNEDRVAPSLRGALAPKQSRAAAPLAPLWIATPQARLAMTRLGCLGSV